uniref:Uncharacterized protein n=2 Tax=Lactuca sativa TaxID=4236 RepID=A0A9R1VGU3_LACSA|nr:hypothetical protein LSAT_V11C500287800 [Lactuca sativa]KAJ0205049.1 hypothetical protein LSAT_V11C500287860 [Lactuca sativa]
MAIVDRGFVFSSLIPLSVPQFYKREEDREEILVIFTAAVILFQQDAKKLVHVMAAATEDNYEYHGLNNASESLKHAMQRAIGMCLCHLMTGFPLFTAEVDRWFLFASFIPPFVSQFQNLEDVAT